VVNQQPKEMGLITAIQHFIDHRVDVVRRRTAYLLARAREREHILVGYQIALDHLDNVIAIIRGSANRAEARDNLVQYFGGKSIEVNVNGKRSEIAIARGKKPEGGFSTLQADAILELQLHRLTRLSIDEITRELGELRGRIAEYESILGAEKKLRGVIIKELEEIKKNYGDARRTQILDETAEIQLEDLIADEQVAVTVSHSGYLKRTPISTYRQQRRGGTGRTGMKTRDEDFVERLIIASTHAYLLIFTNTGRVYWLKVYEIPDVGPAGKGKHIGNLVSLNPGESVRAILNVRDLEEASRYVFFATRNGTVKKTPLVDFSNVMSRGIIAIGIDKDDELVAARITDGKQIVFLASHEGMAIRFDEEDVRPMGRPAYGVRGMDLEDRDYVVGMAITPKDGDGDLPASDAKANGKAAEAKSADAKLAGTKSDRSAGVSPASKPTTPGAKADSRKPTADSAAADEVAPGLNESGEVVSNLILSVTENGYGKRTQVTEYRLQSRGGKGVINVKTTERNGKVRAILLVHEDSELMIISHYGKIIRIPTSGVREAGRSTQGVRLLSLDAGDKVAASVVIPPDEKEENGNGNLIQ
jgi:DNA gyrase subunit A